MRIFQSLLQCLESEQNNHIVFLRLSSRKLPQTGKGTLIGHHKRILQYEEKRRKWLFPHGGMAVSNGVRNTTQNLSEDQCGFGREYKKMMLMPTNNWWAHWHAAREKMVKIRFKTSPRWNLYYWLQYTIIQRFHVEIVCLDCLYSS